MQTSENGRAEWVARAFSHWWRQTHRRDGTQLLTHSRCRFLTSPGLELALSRLASSRSTAEATHFVTAQAQAARGPGSVPVDQVSDTVS
jgi:hypothetical protein